MHFAEAEQKYRELESKLLSGELNEQQFAAQVNQWEVTDAAGRRWKLNARTGRWLVHDGQQWVGAEPAELAAKREYTTVEEFGQFQVPVPADSKPAARPAERADRRRFTTRSLVTAFLTLVILACLVGGGVSVWVFFLRDLGEPVGMQGEEGDVSLVVTYTPRPVTATYTPTFTPTPSRTATPTATPVVTKTQMPTATERPPSPTPTAQATATSTVVRVTRTPTPTPTRATPTPVPPVTYIVKRGDTLSEIAARFGVTVAALLQANDINDPRIIRPGRVLIIPVPGATVVAATGSTPTGTPSAVSTSAASPTPKPTRTRAPTPVPITLSGKIAFAVWNIYTNSYDLFISNVDGTGRNLLGNGFRQPALRQDGEMLAANGEGAPNFEHLVMMNTSGGELVEISQYVEDGLPSWSPAADIVAFSSTAYVDRESRLGIVYDIYGKQQDWIRIGNGEIHGENPFWMADGHVVYHGCDFLVDHAACGLFVTPSSGGGYRRLTTDTSDTSPAGYQSRVAFMSSRDGNWEIYAINLDGTGLKRLTNNSANDGLPTWSPDGKSIAFVSNRSGAWAIWAMNANGDSQRKLFDLGGGYGSGSSDWIFEQISWSP